MNTMQQEFDIIVAHLYKQGKPSKNGKDCLYRFTEENGNVLSCAVGCRISDSAYTKEMDDNDEDTTVEYLINSFGKSIPPEFLTYQDFYCSMQKEHDMALLQRNGNFDLDCLKGNLGEIAKVFKLKLNVPKHTPITVAS